MSAITASLKSRLVQSIIDAAQANRVTGGAVGTGNGTNLVFAATLANPNVVPNSVKILVGTTVVAQDDGKGGFEGVGATYAGKVQGTINYVTGALRVEFGAGLAPANAAAVTANYVRNFGIATNVNQNPVENSSAGFGGDFANLLLTEGGSGNIIQATIKFGEFAN